MPLGLGDLQPNKPKTSDIKTTRCTCAARRIPDKAEATHLRDLRLTAAQAKQWAGMFIHEPHCPSQTDITRGGDGVLRVIAKQDTSA